MPHSVAIDISNVSYWDEAKSNRKHTRQPRWCVSSRRPVCSCNNAYGA